MLFQGMSHILSDLGLVFHSFEGHVLAEWIAHKPRKHEILGWGHSQFSLYPAKKRLLYRKLAEKQFQF